MERGICDGPRERRETSEQDLFRSRLDQIIDTKHALVKLARAIDWGFLEPTVGAVYTTSRASRHCRAADGGASDPQAHSTFPTRLCAIAGWRTRTSVVSRIFRTFGFG